MFKTANFSSNLRLSRSCDSNELGSSEFGCSEMGLSSFDTSTDFGVILGRFEGVWRVKNLWVLEKIVGVVNWVLGFVGEGEVRWNENVVGLVMAEAIDSLMVDFI